MGRIETSGDTMKPRKNGSLCGSETTDVFMLINNSSVLVIYYDEEREEGFRRFSEIKESEFSETKERICKVHARARNHDRRKSI